VIKRYVVVFVASVLGVQGAQAQQPSLSKEDLALIQTFRETAEEVKALGLISAQSASHGSKRRNNANL